MKIRKKRGENETVLSDMIFWKIMFFSVWSVHGFTDRAKCWFSYYFKQKK